MLTLISENPDFWFILAQILGLMGLALMVISFQINHKRTLLSLQILASAMHALQYICLGALSGSLMSLLAAVRNLLYSHFQKVPKLLVASVVLCIIGLNLIFYDGPVSLLPGIATIIYTVSFASNNLTIVRLGDVIACIFYIIYNICVGAYAGIAATATEMLSSLVAIMRFDWHPQRQKAKVKSKSH